MINELREGTLRNHRTTYDPTGEVDASLAYWMNMSDKLCQIMNTPTAIDAMRKQTADGECRRRLDM